jgi:hypothetical protein
MGAGHCPFPGSWRGWGLLRRVGRIIEAGQAQPQRVDAQHPGHGHPGVPLLQRHLQPGRQVGQEPAVTQHAQHR